jgi:hypothetical protein
MSPAVQPLHVAPDAPLLALRGTLAEVTCAHLAALSDLACNVAEAVRAEADSHRRSSLEGLYLRVSKEIRQQNLTLTQLGEPPFRLHSVG